uniref:Beta-1,4-galactosyltransferase n=1 Tax=Phasianus colchicus TaxID=9054 RepID=A0A669QQ22_PHACC
TKEPTPLGTSLQRDRRLLVAFRAPHLSVTLLRYLPGTPSAPRLCPDPSPLLGEPPRERARPEPGCYRPLQQRRVPPLLAPRRPPVMDLVPSHLARSPHGARASHMAVLLLEPAWCLFPVVPKAQEDCMVLLASSNRCVTAACCCLIQCLFVLNQDGDVEFNCAQMLNAASVEALKKYSCDCFVFSDVNLILMDDRNTYKCYSHLKFRFPYNQYSGDVDVSGVSKEQFAKMSGFQNTSWGWGGEDDDTYSRLVFEAMGTSLPDAIIGKSRMIHPLHDQKNEPNPKRYVTALSILVVLPALFS